MTLCIHPTDPEIEKVLWELEEKHSPKHRAILKEKIVWETYCLGKSVIYDREREDSLIPLRIYATRKYISQLVNELVKEGKLKTVSPAICGGETEYELASIATKINYFLQTYFTSRRSS